MANFAVVLFNLSPAVRMGLKYIMPVTLALESDVKRYSPFVILSGATSSGAIIDRMPKNPRLTTRS